MERLCFCLVFLFCCVASFAQVFTAAMTIEVCTNKTVSLVFPANIVSTDRGSEAVIIQKAAENILKVKSSFDSCRETNLTVVTSDNKLYTFIVRYAADPRHLSIFLGRDYSVKTVSKLDPLCKKVARLRPNLFGLQYRSGKVRLRLFGWYVQGQTMFCKLTIENRSSIGYDIEQLRFYIRDNNGFRRTASQEVLLQPLLISGDTTTIHSRASRIWVIALQKFTIPDEKHFEVEVLERNGGRHLHIKMYNRQLMLAKEF